MAIVRLFDAQVGSHDGFLLLSKLATEFSLCTRTEAIFFKQCMANFKLGKQQSVRDAVDSFRIWDVPLWEVGADHQRVGILRSEMFLQDGEKSRLLMSEPSWESSYVFAVAWRRHWDTYIHHSVMQQFVTMSVPSWKHPMRFIQLHSPPKPLEDPIADPYCKKFMGFIGNVFPEPRAAVLVLGFLCVFGNVSGSIWKMTKPKSIRNSLRRSCFCLFQGYSYTYIPYHPCMVYLPTFGRLLW